VQGTKNLDKYGRLTLASIKIAPLPNPSLTLKTKFKIESLAFKTRDRLSLVFKRNLPEPQASLLSGIVLGSKSKLEKGLYQKLQDTGMLHVVVASGYNLTVISQHPVDFLSWWISRKPALIAGWILIWSYAFISGAQPPIIRAVLIVSLVYLAQFLGKKFNTPRALLAVFITMVLWDPSLVENISFQLSFGAMTGILLFSPLIAQRIKLPIVSSVLAESLGSQLVVLPIIAWHFSRISPLSPLINILLLPMVPFITQIGLISLAVSIVKPLSILLIYLSFPLLHIFLKVIDYFSAFSFASLEVKINVWLILGYLLLLLYVLRKTIWIKQDKNDKIHP
jgi:competence protein ComEC